MQGGTGLISKRQERVNRLRKFETVVRDFRSAVILSNCRILCFLCNAFLKYLNFYSSMHYCYNQKKQ